MKRMQQALLAAVFASATVSTTGALASTWTENSAGDTLSSAELVSGTAAGDIESIVGSMETIAPVDLPFSVAHTDLFRIYVSDVATFSATTDKVVDDTALFLFDARGHGVFTNDDDHHPGPLSTSGLQSTLPVGSLAGRNAGFYYLGIGLTGTVPLDVERGAMFNDDGTPVSTAGPLYSWARSELSQTYSDLPYEIDLTGVSAVPEPGSAALLLAGLAVLGTRRTARRAPRP